MGQQLFEKFEALIGIPTPDGVRDDLIQARIFDHTQGAPVIALANCVFSLVVTIILYSHVSAWMLLPWCVAMQAAGFIQFRMWFRNRYHRDRQRHPKRVHSIQINTLIVGALWGFMGSLGLAFADPVTDIQLGVIATVVVAGGVVLFGLMPLCSMLLFASIAIPMFTVLTIKYDASALTVLMVLAALTLVNILVSRLLFQRNLDSFMIAHELKSVSLRLENEAEIRARIVADTSHELRTPLNAIIGFSEMITHRVLGEVQPSKYGEYAEDIQNSARHLLLVIDDILDLSKMESGDEALRIEEDIDTRELIEQAVRMTGKLYRQQNVTITIDPLIQDYLLTADRRRISQVLMNLLSNAGKYTNSGGHVTVSAQPDDNGNLVIAIADNGFGMSKKEIDDALRPFGRTSSSEISGSNGHGLGLPIVAHILKLHEGRLAIESEKGKGSTMKAVLPRTCWKVAETASSQVLSIAV